MDLLRVGVFSFLLGAAMLHMIFTLASSLREDYSWRGAHGPESAALWFLVAFSSIPAISTVLEG